MAGYINSDGPLFDMEGDVIGVDKGIFSDISSGNNGLGLCHSL
jgi:S1-C subfamily serine protease